MLASIHRLGLVLGLTLCGAAMPAVAQDGDLVTFSTQTASVTYGPYGRFALGTSANSYDNGRWQNGQGDPTISFGLMDEDTGFGELAVGFDWQNGFRADLAFAHFGSANAIGPCVAVSDLTPCNDHADISAATISTDTIMANLFYAPMEHQGSNSVFQPFVMAGLGIAINDVGNWTREANPGSPAVNNANPADNRPFRTFEGNTEIEFAWSVGLGASWQVSRPGRHPVILEASWRYFDLGTASGGANPVPPSSINGNSSPTVPLTFDNTRQVFSLGVRIPLQRL